MAIPIINNWGNYYPTAHEGLGSSYERIILNKLLLKIYDLYEIHTALEAPCFGFTGITGINLVALAKKGVEVHLMDHDEQRLQFVSDTWASLALPVSVSYNVDYRFLQLPDRAMDLGFNFSALWFAPDLAVFIKEFCRVVDKCILICVPNRDGIGFKGQLKGYSKDLYPDLYPQHIDIPSIKYLMRSNGWTLVDENYIDCPPWPDIGMSKEDYFQKLLGKTNQPAEKPTEPSTPVSILPYYRGEDPQFEARMLRFQAFELFAPDFLKRFWAHHRYMLFTREQTQ